jgi:hypothetical protein
VRHGWGGQLYTVLLYKELGFWFVDGLGLPGAMVQIGLCGLARALEQNEIRLPMNLLSASCVDDPLAFPRSFQYFLHDYETDAQLASSAASVLAEGLHTNNYL